MLVGPLKNQMEKISDSDVSTIEKHEILSNPWIVHGIFTVLAGTILPELVS